MNHALKRFHEDLERLGLRKRRQHDARRSFITLARSDGARKDVLEWVTHGPRGDIVDLYTTLPWEALCAEVAKLRIFAAGGKGDRASASRDCRCRRGGRTLLRSLLQSA